MARSGLQQFLGQGIRFFESAVATTYFGIKAAAGIATSFYFTSPSALPPSTQALVVDASGNMSYASLGAGGTVTSVALSAPSSVFGVSGSPITTAGTLSIALVGQAANTVFAAPDGSTGTPTFRTLVANDIPVHLASKISNFDTQVRTTRLDQMAVPTASVSFNGQTLTNLGAPVNPSDAATKAYADALIVGGVKFKGNADASATTVALAVGTSTFTNGDQYRVTTAGSTAFGFQLNVGDFVIYNGATWNKIDNTDPSITGTANRTTVVTTGDTSYSIDIASNYAGQTTITTLGTIATGTWQGTSIALGFGGTGATNAAGARTNLGAAGIYRTSFTNASITAGVLTITHGLGQQFNRVAIYDNNNKEVIADEITATSATQTAIDLTSFGTLTGTWQAVVVG